MTHPGEQFYPEGVRWDDPIAQGSLPDLLSKAAADYGPRTALEFRDRPITYTELAAQAERAAAAFLRAGCKGSSIALFLGNTPDHPVNFFGALKAGSRLAHLSPLDGEIALTHKVSDSGSRLLVTSNLAALLPTALKFLEKGLIDRLVVCEDDHWGKIGTPQAAIPDDPRIVTFKSFVEGASAPAEWPVVTADDVALLQYTGGTTGLPKGAMLTHGNLTSAVSIYDVWGKPSRAARGETIEHVICVLPLFHIYALTVVLLSSLSRGNLISLHQRFDVEAVMRDIEVKRATYFPGVPTMWIAIAALPDLDKRDFSSLATIGSGGAPLPVEIANFFERKVGKKLRSGWGMTETCSPGTGHPPTGPDKPGSIGLMLPGIELDVVALDDPKRVLSPGEVGEIRIKGPNVTRGYWNKPEGSTDAFVDGRFLTGDIGYVDGDGYFFLVDRKKDMIISGGFNVYPQMIEQAIYTIAGVHEVIVLGIPDQYRGEAAKAFIKLKPEAKPFSLDELRAQLTGKLGKHELPAEVEFVDDLPRTPVGKLSRHELRQQQKPSQSTKTASGARS
ncbi:dicarboxylate--CoA ligase PimA [Bradyrhizobium sp. 23AC]